VFKAPRARRLQLQLRIIIAFQDRTSETAETGPERRNAVKESMVTIGSFVSGSRQEIEGSETFLRDDP
jgi:hypothetical protein